MSLPIPSVLYHGTAMRFSQFVLPCYDGIDGAVYFTPLRAVARQFAITAMESAGGRARVIRAALTLRHPKLLNAADIMDTTARGTLVHSFAREYAAIALARREGYDGLIVRSVPEHDGVLTDEYAVFSPEQITQL